MKRRSLHTHLLIAVVVTAALPPLAGRTGGPLVVRAARAQAKVKNPHGDYKEDCALCHRATGWKPAQISEKFDHEKFGIPLTGAHASVACTACHTSLDFAMAPTACIDCHADVHSGELGTDCARCHGTRSFIDRNDQIRMHRLTRFPLGGAHQTLDCEVCHRLAAPGSLSWVNTPSDCASCHMADYSATTAPDHAAAGFSQDCAACHNDQVWSRVRFDHGETAFPLSGVHASLACESCHVGGVFTGLATACVSCHQQDYDATTDPAHGAAGFSTECQTCHTTRGWTGAAFNHAQWFPINSGTHAGKWQACADCHINPASYEAFSCLGCHPHDDQPRTDGDHDGENGYAYDSNACYDCHPDGRH